MCAFRSPKLVKVPAIDCPLTNFGTQLGSMGGGGTTPISRGGSSNVMGVNNSYSPYSMMPSSRNISDYRNASFGEAGRMSPQGSIGNLGQWSSGGSNIYGSNTYPPTAASSFVNNRYSDQLAYPNFYNRRG